MPYPDRLILIQPYAVNCNRGNIAQAKFTRQAAFSAIEEFEIYNYRNSMPPARQFRNLIRAAVRPILTAYPGTDNERGKLISRLGSSPGFGKMVRYENRG